MLSRKPKEIGLKMILRIRTQLGIWRLHDVTPQDTFYVLKERIEREHNTSLIGNLAKDLSGSSTYEDQLTVQQANLKNGDMLFILVDETKAGVHENAQSSSKMITKDGTLQVRNYDNISNSNGFRPGMLPLRSMKKHWTLTEFIALDEQFEFKLKAPEKSVVTLASVDKSVMEEFVSYMKSYNFQRMRIGYLYGTFNEKDKTARADFLYEPPQATTDISFQLLEDPNEEKVNMLAKHLDVQKVGWIFAHPPREEKFHFSNAEVLCAAEQQLEAAGGPNIDTLFFTVKVTLDEEGKPLVDAWQICKQGLDMVAEGALEVSQHPGMSVVNSTFTAYVELKPVKEVDNNFFITRVPIGSYETIFISTFPRLNRPEVRQGVEHLKKQLQKVGQEGWSMKQLLADFHLLLFLSNFMDMANDIPRLCHAITDLDAELDEGDQIIIRSIADM